MRDKRRTVADYVHVALQEAMEEEALQDLDLSVELDVLGKGVGLAVERLSREIQSADLEAGGKHPGWVREEMLRQIQLGATPSFTKY